MGMEFELKFGATAEIQEKILQDFPQDWQEISMHTRYYDTPSFALSAFKYTLRRRTENGTDICTVKTPAGNFARGEWETECQSIEKAIPELIRLGAPENLQALTEEGLVEICGARFTRRALTVAVAGGSAEIALDQGILTGGGRERPLCEVEVELKSGERIAAEQLAGILAKKYGLQPERKSKFRRALDLARGE